MSCRLLESMRSCHISIQEDWKLLLSYQSPHKPVQPGSIARQIKQILKDSGLDMEVFSAHYARGAALLPWQGCQLSKQWQELAGPQMTLSLSTVTDLWQRQ